MLSNLLQMNDWYIKKFLLTVIAVKLVILGLVILSSLGINIPFLRYIFGFIYLTFIPGIIILRILKIHQLGSVRTLLYSVGLSLAFNIFLGFIVNSLYPYLGITRPISTFSLLITSIVVLGILSFVCYKRDKDFGVPANFNAGNLFSAPVLLFTLLPLVSILGTQLVNNYNNNLALMILIATISLVPVLLTTTRLVPKNYYPFIILMTSISLLFHTVLISDYIWGWDIRLEYYMYKVVVENNHWSSIEPLHQYNILSVTILPAIYRFVLNIEGTWIFKVIFPLFFSLVPLALFHIFQKQFGRGVAFLSVFYFMAVTPFFWALLQFGKQMMAEVFFAIFLVALLDDKLGPLAKRILVVVFGALLVISHYSTAYIFILVLLLAYIILFILKRKSTTITITLSTLFIVLSFGWCGLSFVNSLNWVYSIYDGFSEYFLDPSSRLSLHMITREKLPLHEILTYLYLLGQFCIAIGFSTIFWNWLRRKEGSISNEYMGISAVLFIMMVLSALLPHLSGVADISRFFHLSLFLLAPFSVYGGKVIVSLAGNMLLKVKNILVLHRNLVLTHSHNRILFPFSLYLLAFFLFTTGFIYEVFNDQQPTSIALSREKVGRAVYGEQEIMGGIWLINSRGQDNIVFFDPYSQPLFHAYWGPEDIINYMGRRLSVETGENLEVASEVPAHSYVYLNKFNVKRGLIHLWIDPLKVKWRASGPILTQLSSIVFFDTIEESNVIYDNGGSLIYYTRTDYSYP